MATTITIPQQQATSYNHPCECQIHGGRSDYLKIAVPLYKALLEGDLQAAKGILKDRRDLVGCCISENKDTPLHVAAALGSTEFVSYLVKMMTKDQLELKNGYGNTAFCIAAISGNVQMAEFMLKENPNLPLVCGLQNKMPLFLAAFHGNARMVTKLYERSGRMQGWTDDKINEVLLLCIRSDIFDVAIKILEDNEQFPQDKKHACEVLQLLAQKHLALNIERQPIISQRMSVKDARPLLSLVWKRLIEKPKDVIDEIFRDPSQILFIAAEMNNTNFLVKLIRGYPDLIWKRNNDGQTIFHIAVAHRHLDVYSLLYEIGSMKDLITPMTDKKGNNILHLVGEKAKSDSYEDRLTSSQMFSAVLWYKEVKGILPPQYREAKNANDLTPRELFIENHEKIFKEGLKSLKESMNHSMVVATLVFAIGFSISFQIPGGLNQNNGFPMFLHNRYFIAFLVLVVISFSFSAISIFCFLSVIISRHYRNIELLLDKWIAGQRHLLGSVLFLAIAFILSFFIQYRKTTLTYIIYAVVCLILPFYFTVILDTLNDVVDADDTDRFKPKKRRLYCKKGKFKMFSL